MSSPSETGLGTDPDVRVRRWRLVGPGIVVAATGVGAGDLVATLIAGGRFGYALLWAAVIGCVVKIALAEAVGRYHLATRSTMFVGWRSLGSWTTVYFGIYVVVWGFVYGAAAMTASALPLAALFGGPLWPWGMACGIGGLLLVGLGHYGLFEKVMTACVGVMFVVVVGLAVVLLADGGLNTEGLVPALPDGSIVYTLGLIGGVGGTITMAAYGYWINAKGWRDATWMRVMRWDNRVAYATTGLFVVAMMVVGAELVNAVGADVASGDRGLLDLDDLLRDRYGDVISTVFLVGFFATSFSSLIGVWNGVSLMVADFWTNLRAPVGADASARIADGSAERSTPFRLYLLWLTFPPISLLFLDEPFGLIIAYGVLGSFFMPFLAITLLWLLNSHRTPVEHRNRLTSNLTLGVAALLFIVLFALQLQDTLAG